MINSWRRVAIQAILASTSSSQSTIAIFRGLCDLSCQLCRACRCGLHCQEGFSEPLEHVLRFRMSARNHTHLLLIRSIAEGGSSRLIDYALHIQACYTTGILCCLPLPIVEVSCIITSAVSQLLCPSLHRDMCGQQVGHLTRDGDYCLRNRAAQVGLCCLLHLCQGEATNLAGRILLPINLETRHKAGISLGTRAYPVKW